jgi:hypothetical protein
MERYLRNISSSIKLHREIDSQMLKALSDTHLAQKSSSLPMLLEHNIKLLMTKMTS